MNTHTLNLQTHPFNQIKNGSKTLELRLYDEKRQSVNIGDRITFQYENESLETEVVGLSRFSSFVELFETLGGISAGWKPSDSPESMSNDMRKYYTEEKEKKYGVLGIHIRLVK